MEGRESTHWRVEQLQDRQAIRDRLYSYHRAVDRADRDGLLDVYWPDAVERHGAFNGPSRKFVEWGLSLRDTFEISAHQMHNVLIELRGERAAVETTFTSLSRRRDAAGSVRVDFLCGRYLDLFEKRQGEWRIASRDVVFDWIEQPAPTPGPHPDRFGHRNPVGSPSRTDPLYNLLRRGSAPAFDP